MGIFGSDDETRKKKLNGSPRIVSANRRVTWTEDPRTSDEAYFRFLYIDLNIHALYVLCAMILYKMSQTMVLFGDFNYPVLINRPLTSTAPTFVPQARTYPSICRGSTVGSFRFKSGSLTFSTRHFSPSPCDNMGIYSFSNI